MKISEIENIKFEPKTVKYKKNPLRGASLEKKNIEKMGQGITSYVISKKNKPHEVKRLTYSSRHPAEDAYLAYLNLIIQNEGNPFFPKVYSLKVLRTKKDDYFYYIEMEKLHPLDTLNWKQLSALIEQNTGLSVSKYVNLKDILKKFPYIEDKKYLNDVVKSDILNTFVSSMRQFLGGDNNVGPFTESTKKALLQVRQMLETHDFLALDLHTGNMMYRNTPYGPQLVMTDPVV